MPNALVTVSNKKGLVPFVQELVSRYGYTIYSSSGTEAHLKENGIAVRSVKEVTQNPEAFGGRMKTISFELGSSLLYRRDNPQDCQEAKALGILDIDLVICNLYPFAEVVKKQGSLDELIENIDIGGPLLLRASAKNYKFVATLCDPEDYQDVLSQLHESGGKMPQQIRANLALKVWQHIADYDQMICSTLHQRLVDETHQGLYLKPASVLRYGENPHQSATFSVASDTPQIGFSACQVLQGKELSYNNYLDADAALRVVSEIKAKLCDFEAVAVVKHGNTCGLAAHKHLDQAFFAAWNSDKISRFGGILCFSGEVSEVVARALIEVFVEVVIAPSFSQQALEVLGNKKNLRLIQMPLKSGAENEIMIKSIYGGYLVQAEDELIAQDYKCVTEAPQSGDTSLMAFGEIGTKYLKSNAIGLFALDPVTEALTLVGSGSGQPNRIDSFCSLAWPRYQSQFPHIKPESLWLVSDAFFPFYDMIEEASKRGIKKMIQPGGSVQDTAVIAKANELGVSLFFTGMRHFRHG